MPRPKVLPSQRQRAVEACNACRSTKKRCSGNVPCTLCQRRGLQDSCYLTVQQGRSLDKRATTKTPAPASSSMTDTIDTVQLPLPQANMSAAAVRATEELPVSPTDGTSMASDMLMSDTQSNYRLNAGSTSRGDGRYGERTKRRTSSASTASFSSTDARMLFNQRGERVYIGSAASISFLQVLRRVVSEQIGPSPFSHNDKAETMLEKASPAQNLGEVSTPCSVLPEISASEKQEYAQCCFAVTEGFLDIFDPAEVDTLLGHLPAHSPMTSMTPMRRACGNLILAVGAQCKSISTAQGVGLPYFREAQRLVLADMLEDPDVDMVRAHLLMAFYLLGECRRNAAFMYLGIATRAALALGLHSRDSYPNMHNSGDQFRLRLWMSVRIMDKLVNSILGRPAATAGVHSDLTSVFEAFNAAPKSPSTEALVAAHGIVCIINEITQKVYEKKEITVRVVEQFLDDIETWKRGLPSALGTAGLAEASSSPSSQGLGSSLGNVHVSCLYYFAVALVTRPILVSGLTTKPTFGTQPAQLAGACLDAATFLSETCSEAYRSGLLQNNMCIMKALLFAAGLVLGFEIFTKRTVDHEIEAAFSGTTEVLGFLATQSPQAAHYLDILTSLSNAALKRRANTRKNRYVSRIFSVGSATAEPPRILEAQSWEESLFLENLGPAPYPGEDMETWNLDQLGGEGLSLDWDSLNISQWDSFPFQGTV